MAPLPPIYKTQNATYRADTCRAWESHIKAGEIRVEALARGRYFGRPLPRGALRGLCTAGFWDADHDQDWELEWQRNEGIEICYQQTGKSAFWLDDRSFQLKPDRITITRPWQRHRVGGPPFTAGKVHFVVLDVGVRRPNQAWKWPSWLTMTKADRDELTAVLRHTEQPVWWSTEEIRHCFQQIGRAVETDRNGSSISRLALHLNELLLLLLEMFRQHPIPLDKSLSSGRRTVELFLEDLLHNPDNLALEWTLHSMAKHCGLGITQFATECRQLTNISPMRYLKRCRLHQASKFLVEQPEMSILDVAMACGFSSSQYFSTAFRREMGLSPQLFRTKFSR